MCLGIIRHEALTRAVAAGPGNPVLLVGADTGRDGIHGATFASVELDEQSEERRPAVQVGNPFLEKCLMEACLELAGDPRIVAMQDLGAAGLTSSTAELAWRGGCGIDLDVARVPRRERGMTPYEVMLSESQERMLLVVERGQESSIMAAFLKWDLHSEVIGTITDTQHIVVRDGTEVVCDLPLQMLIDDVPMRHPQAVRPAHLDALQARDPLAEAPPWDMDTALLALLSSPNIGSRRPIFRRYDHQVGDDTVIPPGGDAALLRIKGTRLAVAATTDGNARYGRLDPRRGAEIAVAEAARNLVATGAEPLAVTNCLNFGNPEKPEVFWQLSEAVDGLAAACEALGTPVVSGNVSLYNDTTGVSIDPTPVIGMVGRIEDVERRLTAGFKSAGDAVFLLGPIAAELGGSEYQRLAHGTAEGPPPALDLALERRVQAAVREAAGQGLLRSAHDCAEGGLAVALAECCLFGGVGVRVELPEALQAPKRSPSWSAGILFGETQSRFLVSVEKESKVQLRALLEQREVPYREIGVVGGDGISIDGVVDVPLDDARAAFDRALLGSHA
jgi:phosphoribosylformylglycinamidine synthase